MANHSVFELLVTQRRPIGRTLVAVGLLIAAWSVWLFMAGPRGDRKASEADPTPKVESADRLSTASDTKSPVKTSKEIDWQVFATWLALIALVVGGSGAWLLTQGADVQAASARVELLAFGGAVGLLTTILGIAYGYRWHTSLVQWVGEGDPREAKWVLYAFATFFAGLVIMFVSMQAGRAEQRNDVVLRRLMYGFNAGFAGLLLLAVLVAVNVVAFMKVPATLVTNSAAFTGLSDQSKEFLQKLDKPVHVYLVLPEAYRQQVRNTVVSYGNLYGDCRALLSDCEDQSRLFTVTYLSPAFDLDKWNALADRLKLSPAEREEYGMIVTVGENESSWSVIPARDLVEVERARDADHVIFQGENRLMTELIYLTDSRSKEKVYFTQGHGELSLEGGRDPARSASIFINFLRDRKVTVEPLNLDAPDAKVPEDAAMVVVAGPRQTVPPDSPKMTALREFSQRPGQQGKLMFFLPAFQGVDGKVAPSGFEGLLADLGIELDPARRVVSQPRAFRPLPNGATITPEWVPTVQAQANAARAGVVTFESLLIFREPRPVTESPQAQVKNMRVYLLLESLPQAWLEDSYTQNLVELWSRMRGDRQLLADKQFGERFGMAVLAADNPAPGTNGSGRKRAIVFASDSILIDQPAIPAGVPQFRHQLLSDLMDLLRERQGAGIPPRKLPYYVLPKPMELSSQLVLLLMVGIGIVAVGGGVWLSRRR